MRLLSEIARTTKLDSGEDERRLNCAYLVWFMLNTLADMKLNCRNVRELRNHFGEKIFM